MKILIIKFGALGDVLRTTSVLHGLKEKYKNSQICWLTLSNAEPLLAKNQYIDEVLVYSQEIRKRLLSTYFDLIINLEEDFEACSIATKAQKKELIGFYLDNNGKTVPTPTMQEWYNMSSLGKKPDNDILKKRNKKTYQQLMLEALRINSKDYEINLRLDSKQIQFARDFKRRYNIRDNDLVIGINTGSGERWTSKRLSVEKTAQLINRLHKDYNAKILLFGGDGEIERNDDIIAQTKVPVINSGCGNDLKEFPALISLCHVFITSDTLGLHIALALKRKVIVLIGPTSAEEIELYGLGKKIVPNDKCVCCYKENCASMEKISLEEVLSAVKLLTKRSASIIITSFHEPRLADAVTSIVQQDISVPHEIIIASPDKEADLLAKKYASKNVAWLKDPGKGKSYAINLLLKKLKGDILIFTDGDVVLEKNSVNEIISTFNDPLVGCVSGRVMSANQKNTLFGFWSHLLADAGAHRIRKELASQDKFLECTGYLFAFRNNVIQEIPLDVAEDAVIPALFWDKGYKIGYSENSLVYVKNPTNFDDWLKQRKRTAKAHETLEKYIDISRIPRVKSFSNEIKKGFFWALAYPKNLKEFIWTFMLFFARFYMWLSVLYDTRIIRKHYRDAWDRVETTKI